MSRPAIFFDRDGVLIEDRPNYVRHWQDVQVISEAVIALKLLAATNYLCVIVSNQSCVGRGVMTLENVLEINAKLVATLEAEGARIDAVYICPHAPDDHCDCRKPKPGLITQAAEELDINLSNSYLIGDALRDALAAEAAGVRPLMVLTGRAEVGESTDFYKVFPNAQVAVEAILNGNA